MVAPSVQVEVVPTVLMEPCMSSQYHARKLAALIFTLRMVAPFVVTLCPLMLPLLMVLVHTFFRTLLMLPLPVALTCMNPPSVIRRALPLPVASTHSFLQPMVALHVVPNLLSPSAA
ncbi:unnamed protein product [Prorocentrum cordatum]|uniref:Uncharacterized protein n=1 Tax=Prorocentrum cordatum TaxID=2364126 RepID=A0ABN9QDF3_9DINO|nr:unnamed protein product [Polarella glacialis]